MAEARREGTEGLAIAGGTVSSPGQQRVRLVDTHAHLAWNDFAADVDEVVRRATAAGLTWMLAVGIDEETSRASVSLAEGRPDISAAVGLHPNSCADAAAQFPAVAALARTHHRQSGGPVVAIGESGLDFYRDQIPPAVQEASFQRHLVLAADLDLPIVVHNRHADDAILRMLYRAPAGLRGVMHCFSAGPAFASASLERGFYLSFAGNVTYRSAADLREVAMRVPAERLLVETDAPFLPPQPWRGRRNEPAYAAETLRVLAETRGVDVALLGQQVVSNARALFRW